MANVDLTQEVIFIGLPGPTHHYGGLSADNIASSLNRGSISSPKLAALQAIRLARTLGELGITIGILPPQLRPHMKLLGGKTLADAPIELLEKASSSSAMWVANAATVTPARDSGTLHITTANLHTNLHRRIEAEDTHKVLAAIFAYVPGAVVHAPLPEHLPDEGAANHMRLCPSHDAKGLHVFVYGEGGRQSLAASKAVAAQHALPDEQVVFVQQNPEVIRAGFFHNDVIAVNNKNLLLVHEAAYVEGGIEKIEAAYHALHPQEKLNIITVLEKDLSVNEAVRAYLFNSQIVSVDGGMAMIAPGEIETLFEGKALRLVQKYFDNILTLDLRQSMRNGGGPACLRLRVPMLQSQVSALKEDVNVLADEALLGRLEGLVEKYYPDELAPEGLRDPVLFERCKALLAELSQVMKLPLLT